MMFLRKLRHTKLLVCVVLPFLLAITTVIELVRISKDLPVPQPSDVLPSQPMKLRKSLKELDLFLPTGEELEKNLTAHQKHHVTSDLGNVTLIGGHYTPDSFTPRHKIAVLIPYRDRLVNLQRFLRHIHPFLQKQGVDYTIYVIEMESTGLFRKTVLMNAGFLEVTKRDNVSCIIFHDVDMVPVNDENLYYCDVTIRHLAVSVTQFKYQKPYAWYNGGVIAFPKEHFITVNGYSNLYIGWGGEDDDMYYRIQAWGINITEPSPEIGRYESWPHERQDLLMNMKDYSNNAVKRMKDDGLSNVKYKLISIEEKQQYTSIQIETDPTDFVNDKYLELQPVFLKWK